MKASEIKVGGKYKAKVSGVLVTVRVDKIEQVSSYRRSSGGRPGEATVYRVTNLKTGRETTFKSAAKFRNPVVDPPAKPAAKVVGVDPATPGGSVAVGAVWDADKRELVAPPTAIEKAVLDAGGTVAGRVHDETTYDVPASALPTILDALGGQHAAPVERGVPVTFEEVPVPPTVVPTARKTGRPRAGDRVVCLRDFTKYKAGLVQGSLGVVAANGATNVWKGNANFVCVRWDDAGEYDVAWKSIDHAPANAPAPPKTTMAGTLKAAMSAVRRRGNAPHVFVVARAGTGKTTTAVEGTKFVRGLETFITPSDQQRLIWEALAESAAEAKFVCFAAFGRDIAAELRDRMPAGCDAATLHSLGSRALAKAMGRLPLEENRCRFIVAEVLGKDLRTLRKERPVLLKALVEVARLCKVNLVGYRVPEAAAGDLAWWTNAVTDLVRHYDVDVTGCLGDVCANVHAVLERAKDVSRDGCVDYTDMIWLPVVLELPIFKYDLLIVDEVQDLSRVQQEIALRSGERIVCIGDDRQAIFGFAGADAVGFDRMHETLAATARGCVKLPLTRTRRCGKAIVREAKTYVPDFEATDDAPDGVVETMRFTSFRDPHTKQTVERPIAETFMPHVVGGDMVVCRATAPLVSLCLKWIKRKAKDKTKPGAVILGRKFGDDLLDLVDSIDPASIEELVRGADDWRRGQLAILMAEVNPSETRIQIVEDKHDCLRTIADDARTVSEVRTRVNDLFADATEADTIRLATIHKAKGLEAENVFYVQGFGRPFDKIKNAWERRQEENLRYVAITRAKQRLVYVD